MAEPIELSTESLKEPVASYDTAISCLARLSGPTGGAARIEAACQDIEPATETLPLSKLVKLAAGFGLRAERVRLHWQGLKRAVSAHPVLVVRDSADTVVVTGGGRSGADEVSVWDPDHDGVMFFVSRDDFERTWSGHALLINWGFGTPPRPQTPPRRSRYPRGLPLGVAAVALVASLGMVLFLLTAPNADRPPIPVLPNGPRQLESTTFTGPTTPRRQAQRNQTRAWPCNPISDGQGLQSAALGVSSAW